MTIILSCGHHIDDFSDSYQVVIKSYSRDFSKALSYRTVCLKCKNDYRKQDILFEDDTQADKWLLNDTEE